MSGRRIYLVASSGYPHYGDELIAAQWLRHLASVEPDAEVWLDCPQPGGASVLLGHLHPNVHFTDTLFRLAWAAPSEDVEEVAEFASQGARQPGFGVPHRAAGVELLHTVDVFHVLGGGYINSIWPRHLGLLAAGGVLAELGKRVVATGLSLVPGEGYGALLDRLTAGYQFVDVSDSASRALLSGGNVSETGDDVLLDLGEKVYDQRETRSVMMSFQSDWVESKGGVQALAESAIATAKAWGVDGSKIGYVEAIPGQDRVAFDLIEPELPGIRFYPFTEVWRDGLPARRGQRWLTTRTHLHLVAAASGAWGVAFPVKEGYYDVQHEDLIARGSRWVMGTPGEAAPQSHGDHGFGRSLEPLVSAKQELAGRIYGR